MYRIFNKNNIGGKVSISGSLGFYGSSPAEFIRGMQMTMEIAARGVEVKGMDLDQIAKDMPNARSNDKKQLEKTMDNIWLNGSTYFNSIDASIAGSNGMFLLSKSALATDYTAINASGKINLLDWNIDLNGKSVFSVNNIPDPAIYDIRMLGDIDNPSQQINKEQLRNFVDVLERYRMQPY
jgi:hypothetical protein